MIQHSALEELRVLGLVLDDIRRFDDLVRHGEDLFASGDGATLYQAMLECHERRGRVIPEIVHGSLRKAVGADNAREIMDGAVEAAMLAKWEPSLGLLIDKAHRRRMLRAANEITAAAMNDDISSSDLDAEAIRAVTDVVVRRDVVDAVTIGEVSEELINQLDSKGPLVKAIPLGIVDLNERIKGWRAGCLYTIAAGTGIGKTHFILDTAHRSTSRGFVFLIVSLEMDRYALRERFLARYAGKYDLTNVVDNDLRGKLEDAVSQVAGFPLYICDNRNIGVQHIQSLARILHAKHGIDGIMVDYLTLLNDPPGVREKRHAVAENVRALRALGGELNIPVIIVSQVSRNLAERKDKRPKITDLYESAVIEQHSDGILLLHREEKYRIDAYNFCPEPIQGVMEVEIAKLRYARDGGRVYLRLDPERSILRAMDKQEMRSYLEAIREKDDNGDFRAS